MTEYKRLQTLSGRVHDLIDGEVKGSKNRHNLGYERACIDVLQMLNLEMKVLREVNK